MMKRGPIFRKISSYKRTKPGGKRTITIRLEKTKNKVQAEFKNE